MKESCETCRFYKSEISVEQAKEQNKELKRSHEISVEIWENRFWIRRGYEPRKPYDSYPMGRCRVYPPNANGYGQPQTRPYDWCGSYEKSKP